MPDLDVEQLEVPTVTEFKSEMGNEYVRERPLEEIIDKLMTPQEEEVEEKQEEVPEESTPEEVKAQPVVEDKKASALSAKRNSQPDVKGRETANKTPKDEKANNESNLEDENKEEDEEPKEEVIKFLQNDYIEKAETQPPKDPYGNDTMHPDLIIAKEALLKIA